jgi:hypothetical protein
VKIIILCFVYSYDYKPTVVNPSLRREDLPSFIIDLNLIPSFEPTSNNVGHIRTSPDHDQSCKPVNNKSDSPLIEIIVSPCNQLTKIQSRIKKYYKPLKLALILHAYPPNFIDYLPMFNGEDHVAAEKHLEYFENFIDNFQIMHEDVVMRIFCKYLFGDETLWFRNLEACSIGSWIDFHVAFLKYWGERKSFDQYLIELNDLKRKEDESLTTFNMRFHSFYYSIPKDIQPSKLLPCCII